MISIDEVIGMLYSPSRNPNVLWRAVEDSILLLDPYTASVKELNKVASIIWELCDGEHTIEEITNILSSKYPKIEIGRIRKDVTKFISVLQNKKYIH